MMTTTNTTLPDGWIETTLGEVTKVFSGSTPSTKESLYWDGNIAWITPKDLSNFNGIFISKGERNITELGFKNSSTQLLPKNTILFSSRAPIGYVAIAENELTTNQGFKNIVCDEKVSHYRFFYYLLKYKACYIESLSSGSTFSEASASLMKSISLLLPPLPEQQAIAKILSSFDDKIELLREQNETLEKLAQTIFQEWFGKYSVDDELPEGWRVGKLSDVADFLNGLALQKFPPKNDGTDLPVIKIRELKSGITNVTDFASSNIDKKYIVQNGDILFSWSGSLEVVIWKYGIGALNQHLFKVSSEKYPKWFYYLWTLYHLDDFRNIASNKATTMGHIQRGHLDLAKVIIPDDSKMQELNEIFEPIIQKFEENNFQIQTLSKTRDELLPKLMKGEVRVV